MENKKAFDLAKYVYKYLKGERVQIKYIREWKDVTDISQFRNTYNEFRVYVEPKLTILSFENKDLFMNKWIKRKGYPLCLHRIVEVSYDRVVIFGDSQISYTRLFEEFLFEDDTPCCLESCLGTYKSDKE